ncbi:hypothetical protein PtA15_16A262 [Puccinia triticina]|uniref:Uncharacterized protein n=1 Tax=Puccinia triticina TaxID=208348 RepID=A0ABY7D4M0_9BASI|nr:uncharacterized protein PtA15_16A262 [Puccinia triticina]WAQ92356.1 hypothetical protein PtA15_16A262 [Puccinia triticina]WAR64089.1 hypothetical protein PtB15_16B249 [Puccinia triticina]
MEVLLCDDHHRPGSGFWVWFKTAIPLDTSKRHTAKDRPPEISGKGGCPITTEQNLRKSPDHHEALGFLTSNLLLALFSGIIADTLRRISLSAPKYARRSDRKARPKEGLRRAWEIAQQLSMAAAGRRRPVAPTSLRPSSPGYDRWLRSSVSC